MANQLSGWLLGRPYQPATPWDPWALTRQADQEQLLNAMKNYDQMMQNPFGFIPQPYQDQMRRDTEQAVRGQYQGQGQAGFVNDRLARAQNDLSMKMLSQNLDQANKQRDYIEQMRTSQMNRPTQMQAAVPEQVGLLGQVGGQMASSAANAFGKQLAGGFGNWAGNAVDNWFGSSDNSDERNRGIPGYGGMTVGQQGQGGPNTY